MLHHLEELARRLDIEVRYEPAAGRVGTGRLRGQRIAVVDAGLRVDERVSALACVLAGEATGEVYVPPAVRSLLDRTTPLRADAHGAWDDAEEETPDAPPADVGNDSGADPEADA